MQVFKARRLAAAFFIVAAALAVVGVSPASAGSDHATVGADCSWDASGEVFGSLAQLTTASSARGDELREPHLGQAAREAPGRGRPDKAAVTIPTWVHVVTPDGVTGDVSDKSIREQIGVLDSTFGGFLGGVATGFDFDLAGITRTVNAEWYATGPGSSAEHAMKQALHRGGDDTLNVYLTTAGPYLGWAYFPSVTETSVAYLDGAVIDWESLPGVSETYAGRYDRGYTATHEVGHWLNLFHTFEGGCGPTGDLVDDTPSENKPTSGCPEGKDTCNGKPGLDPIHNFMDYSYDACYTEFTAGQVARMQDAWAFWRAS